MSVPIPVILYPTSEPAFSTNLELLTLAGTYDVGVTSILVNGSSGGVVLSGGFISGGVEITGSASGGGTWSFTTQLAVGTNTFNVSATNGVIYSAPDTIEVIYQPALDSTLLADIPSGIVLVQGLNQVTLSAPTPSNPNFIGFNFYGSEDAGGGSNGYTLLNSSPLSTVAYTTTQTTLVSQTVTTSGNLQTTTTVQQITTSDFVSYIHNRINQPLGTLPITQKNYYVITTVIFDPNNKVLVESGYSEELSGAPITINTSLKQIDQRTQSDFTFSLIDQLLQANDTWDQKPGTVFRDALIDPNAQMFARLFTILRFMSISQSFPGLLQFDDPDNTGTSAPVTTDQDKDALRDALLVPVTQASLVQDLIDAAFDKLAGNVNVQRLPAAQAIGTITVYTISTPVKDVTVQVNAICATLEDDVNNIPSVQFQVLSGFVLQVASLAQYYNPTTNRYEFTLPIRAVVAGSAGNVNAGTIVSTVSGFDAIFGVTNPNPTEFGSDEESNQSLATRAQLAFISVDSGTTAGLFSRTLTVQGVTRAEVVGAGNPLMQRDLDPIRGIHSLGKVDIYVQGASFTNVTETMGFSYEKVAGEQFQIQSVTFYQFYTENPLVDAEHPIFQVFEVRNLTRNADYDLTNLTISGNGNLIDLDETIPANILIGLGPNDLIEVTYRFRYAANITFGTQPVENIVSVVGSESGTLTTANYELWQTDDPLVLGRSTDATDQIAFIYANGLPNGNRTVVTNTPVVLAGTLPSALPNIDIDDSTIVVILQSNSQVLLENLDYQLIPGDAKTATQIERIVGGAIPDGATVLVSYDAGEIMTVTYEVNSILGSVQTVINEIRHATADIVVKSAQGTPIDIDMTVSLASGADPVTVNMNIRTALGNFYAAASLGQNIYQSDVIKLVQQIAGVEFVVVPFTKMVKSDGTQVIREELTNPQFVPFVNSVVQSYRSTETLSSATIATGGPDNLFRGVFQNDFPLTMMTVDTDVANAAGQAYIDADGHIVVSPIVMQGLDPNASTWTVTYIVEGDTGAKDIIVSGIEYPTIGNFTITFAQTGQSFTS